MTRTCAGALALVNWKGVFYERYLFDRHVTALEGANGAGKTTVMIAAYIVLLPDMSRLRFTNLGETSATGGDRGVWGRLGDLGRPSYAVIDFILPGKRRLVAGVHLERKGEPSVEPTAFIVTDLGPDVRLQDLLLLVQGETEAVPELSELRENAAKHGGWLKTFASVRDYLTELFDHGVLPLRLGTDEERNKFNEMLRTSMTGGISSTLSKGLRSFLLKEEAGLANTLQRMRANLDACRRTRIEVQESRRLEHEIGGVYEAGHTMFAAAFSATRERADELSRRVDTAEAELVKVSEAEVLARKAFEKTVAELEKLEIRHKELGGQLTAAQKLHTTLRDAQAAFKRLSSCTQALDEANRDLHLAAQVRSGTETQRALRRGELRRAEAGYNLAAQGLADLQQGIQELHRRAGAFRQVVRRLSEAELNLQASPLPASNFSDCLRSAQAELGKTDQERREVKMLLDDATAHRSRHEEAMKALRSLCDDQVEVENAYQAAITALGGHRDCIALARRLPVLEENLSEEHHLEARQVLVRQQAHELGVVITDESAKDSIIRLLDSAEAERADREVHAASYGTIVTESRLLLNGLTAQEQELRKRLPQWLDLDTRANRIGVHLGTAVLDRPGLEVARIALAEQLATAKRIEEELWNAQERLLLEARELLAAEGPFSPDLLQLRDRLGAELLATSFEDLALEEAGRFEAQLGSLTQALVVDDPHRAAAEAADRPDALCDLWLVARDANLEGLTAAQLTPRPGERDLRVNEGPALRISRIPSRPRLGRRARERRAAELRQEAATRAIELNEARVHRHALERLINDGDLVLAGHALWLAGNPALEMDEVHRQIAETEERLRQSGQKLIHHNQAAQVFSTRIKGLRALLGEAFLLDPPDHGLRLKAVMAELEAARRAKVMVSTKERHAEHVDRELAVLRQPPLNPDEILRLEKRLEELILLRNRLESGIDALEYVLANRVALTWNEAPERLAVEQELLPALNTQLQEAKQERDNADKILRETEQCHEESVQRFHAADANQKNAAKEHESARNHFESFGVPRPTEKEIAAAAHAANLLAGELSNFGQRRDDLLKRHGSEEKVAQQAQKAVQAAEAHLTVERREAEPALKRWQALQDRAERHGLTGALHTERTARLGEIRGHVNLVQEAKAQEKVLLERLRGAQDGPALLKSLELLHQQHDTSDVGFADACLDLWLAVRDWLHRRLPAQMAEQSDPSESLLLLRDRLMGLEERLSSQERDLRGESEDVAKSISVQIRKARGQVMRLNQNLEGVGFGSIQGICVRLDMVERMDQILRALRTGAVQGLLFQADIPIEEALDQIFKRHGGGRTGGQRLLDYREYVHLHVEIRRRAGGNWEQANPNRLSTGEAIGVGAALMMVVLTEWERDATFLRGKRSHGSLRFLFLDEANRLSHDNLGIIFDLCRTLDLQLLIAAPEVARAEGNTTYHLVRRTTVDGREEVVVSGRRIRAKP